MVPREMVLYRLADATLLIHSAIALNEPEMAKLESLGTPKILVVSLMKEAATWSIRKELNVAEDVETTSRFFGDRLIRLALLFFRDSL